MKKAIKISLITITAIILLLIIGAVVVVNVIDPNDYKPQIQAMVKKQTGRTLTIDGKISWSFFPWLGLNVGDVELSNANGFGDKPMIKFEEADASVKLLPLLSKEINIRTLSLKNLALNLSKNRQGVSNWDDLIKKSEQKTTDKPQDNNNPTDNSSLSKFSISNIDISNAKIHWQDQQSNQNMILSNINLQTKNVAFGEKFPIEFTTKIEDKIKRKTINIKASSDVTMTKNLTSLRLDNINFNVNDLNLIGKINASDIQADNMHAQGELKLKTFNPSKFLDSIGQTSPASKDALQKLSADLRFNASKNLINLSSINLKLDKTTITGNTSIRDFSRPNVKFRFDIDQINLDQYMSKQDSQATASSTHSNQQKQTPTDFSALRKYTVDGSIAIKKLQMMNLHTSDVNTKLNMNNGIVRINDMRAKLYRGTFNGNVTLNAQTNTPKTNINARLANVQIQPLLKDFMNKTLVSGTAKFNMNLNTRGLEQKQAIRHLNGHMNFDLKNGEIQGINIDHQIERAKALINKEPAPAKPTSNTTQFGDVSGSANIVNGVASNNDFLIDAPGFRANGQGKIDLINQLINYSFNVRPLKAGNLNNYALPLRINGSFDSPSVSLDTASLLQQVIKQQMRKNINQQGGKLLGRLFGR